jgi:PLP dependent protein
LVIGYWLLVIGPKYTAMIAKRAKCNLIFANSAGFAVNTKIILMQIQESVKKIISELPENVTLVAAAKTRSVEEVKAAIAGGVKILGYNYVQEAEMMNQHIGSNVKWHMIGHLQRNKVRKIIHFVNMIETIDSVRLAETVNRQCAEIKKILPVLIEVNSGREKEKAGVFPEDVVGLVRDISRFQNVRIEGLMTMGPLGSAPEESRPYFKVTKNLFDEISELKILNVNMRFLSMGMSDSYKIAIEEGANIVRIGTALFGPRNQ